MAKKSDELLAILAKHLGEQRVGIFPDPAKMFRKQMAGDEFVLFDRVNDPKKLHELANAITAINRILFRDLTSYAARIVQDQIRFDILGK